MLKIIPIEKLHTSKNVRRQYDDEIKLLAESIRTNGLLEPLVVEESIDGHYKVICGHRRFMALKMIGEISVECNVIKLEEDRNVVQLIENVHRRDMLPWELTAAFDELKERYHLTNEQLAQRLGKTKSWVMNQYTKTHLLEKTYGTEESKSVSKKEVSRIYNAYKEASKRRSGSITEYTNGLKVARLMKTDKRDHYKYEIKFTSEEFRAKLESLIEQEGKK